MPAPHPLLVAALAAAPRRYRLPALPGNAAACGPEVALAAAIEAARVATDAGQQVAPGVRDRFTAALAELIARALSPEHADAAFQARVWHASHPEVDEYVRLAATVAADRRALRAAVDAIAHPGKLREAPAGPARDALERLHRLAATGAWAELERAAHEPLTRETAAAIRASPALHRLLRHAPLVGSEPVQRYRELCERRAPVAGSIAAAERGRAASRAGELAEKETLAALRAIADQLQRAEPGASYRVLSNLRLPRGFPAGLVQAKEEWDAALARARADAAADVVLLVEVKASPAAAAPDLGRLLRGLHRLAVAEPDSAWRFPCSEGEVMLSGRSLRALQPHDRSLPPHVIYCCSAVPEAQPAFLAPAPRAMLLEQPASIAFARRLADGSAPGSDTLGPVWDALLASPRLRPVLHQLETARAAREAMLHPNDLAASVARVAGGTNESRRPK